MAKAKISKEEAERVLGLTGSYTAKDLNRAYRKVISTAHPDAGGDQEYAVRVNAAKETLTSLFREDKDAVIECGPGFDYEEDEYYDYYESEPEPQEQPKSDPWGERKDKWEKRGFYRSDTNEVKCSKGWVAVGENWVWIGNVGVPHEQAEERGLWEMLNKEAEEAWTRAWDKTTREQRYAEAGYYRPATQEVKCKYGWLNIGGNKWWIGNVGVPFEESWFGTMDNDRYSWRRANEEAEGMWKREHPEEAAAIEAEEAAGGRRKRKRYVDDSPMLTRTYVLRSIAFVLFCYFIAPAIMNLVVGLNGYSMEQFYGVLYGTEVAKTIIIEMFAAWIITLVVLMVACKRLHIKLRTRWIKKNWEKNGVQMHFESDEEDAPGKSTAQKVADAVNFAKDINDRYQSARRS